MERNLNSVLIENIVRKNLKTMKDNPERSARNMIDMALEFSDGRFQHRFFEVAQSMLENEQSAYYKMIVDYVTSVDEERIVRFGMNVGYNSCTKGAQRIRELEAKEQFNIPWTIYFEMGGNHYLGKNDIFTSLVEQGQKLGIFTWMVHVLDGIEQVLELPRRFPESAFVLFCSPNDITESLLDDMNDLYNVMFAVEYADGVEDACGLLRYRGLLYSICFLYDEEDMNSIVNGDVLGEVENMHPVFTGFMAERSCSVETQAYIYQYIKNVRNEQIYRTIPWDINFDNHYVDGIISDDACAMGFEHDGAAYSFVKPLKGEEYKLSQYSLEDILRVFFPKTL